jgi:hypothetical protein
MENYIVFKDMPEKLGAGGCCPLPKKKTTNTLT